MGNAIFPQQKNGLYAVNIVAQCGVLTPEQLLQLSQAAQEFNVWRLKFGSRQTIVALLEENRIADFVDKVTAIGLKIAPFGNMVRNVKACAGTTGLCPRALGDALGLGIELQEKYMCQPTPKDFKISVAGCPRGCTDPYCADLGFVSKGVNRFDVFIGGRGATDQPKHGQLLVQDVLQEKICPVVDYVLEQYRIYGEPNERLCKTIQRIGLEMFTPPLQIYGTENNDLDEFAEFLLA